MAKVGETARERRSVRVWQTLEARGQSPRGRGSLHLGAEGDWSCWMMGEGVQEKAEL